MARFVYRALDWQFRVPRRGEVSAAARNKSAAQSPQSVAAMEQGAEWSVEHTRTFPASSLDHPPCLLDAFPQSLEIRRAECAIVQTVARSAALAPNHAAVIRSDWAIEPCAMERGEHAVQVDIAETRRMRSLAEFLRPRDFHIPTMSEMNSPSLSEISHHARQVVGWISAK